MSPVVDRSGIDQGAVIIHLLDSFSAL